MARYLVTGASGFIGTHLIRKLVSDGVDVVAVDWKEPREKLSGVEYHLLDIRALSSQAFVGRIDRIYNLAAVHTTPGHQPYEYYETNVSGAVEVTRLAEALDIPEIVFTSSISVYGPSEDMKTEISTPTPVSDYGHSKFLAEQIHRQWLDRGLSRKLTIVRPAVVFGPGERGNFTRLAQLLKRGFFFFPGRKDTIKACIYVSDLIDAIAFAHSRSERYVLFNGAYPNRYTLDDIVSVMISDHFKAARAFLVPRAMLTIAAQALGPLGFLNIGIHPERVSKLVRSTDVYPDWLVENGFAFTPTLAEVFDKWRLDTRGTFV